VVLLVGSLVSLAVLSRPPVASRLFRLLLLGAFLVAAALLCLWDMVQREQIASILTLPYALLAARAATGQRASPAGGPPSRTLPLIAGMMAAVAFALKPFFLGAFAAIELTVLVSAGWRRTASRIEPWT